MLNRRAFLLAAPASLAFTRSQAAPPTPMMIYKTASCGCCNGWITLMRRAGFAATVVAQDDLRPVFNRHGIPFELSSCHVAEVDTYVAVGHVPAADIRRLLRERPKAIGLTVPGMPLGSPGMEQPDGRKEPYQTLLLLPGGKTRVFARHG